MGGLAFLLQCNFELSKIQIKLINFHRQVLLSWLLIYKHIFSPNKCIILNNRYISIKHKTSFFQKWVDDLYLAV